MKLIVTEGQPVVNDVDTPFGRKEFDTKKNTSKINFEGREDTRHLISLRKKYRQQS